MREELQFSGNIDNIRRGGRSQRALGDQFILTFGRTARINVGYDSSFFDEVRMSGAKTNSFPPGVDEKLKTYVYRLIDPRNGETFYVGKGRGNRLFAHIRDELKKFDINEDATSLKLKRIRDIRLAGFDAAHVVHRHGMDDKTALEVEAALIDAYPGLSNEVVGIGTDERGAMHVQEIIKQYLPEPADLKHKALLISVNSSAMVRPLYDATRYAWKLNTLKAMKADFVLATRKGLIVGAYIPHRWLEATPENFPGREPSPGRWGFEGEEAPDDIKRLYIGKRVPDKYRKPGASNPIKYTW